jgi:polysaccharide biosynthesis transport protein
MHMSPTANESRETGMRDFLLVVFRRKWVVLAVVLAAVGVVVAMERLLPDEYESTSQVLISRGQPESAYSSGVRILTWEEDLNSELEMVKSEHILHLTQKLLDDSKVKDSRGRPVRVDPARVMSSTPGKSSIIVVTVRDHDPKAAQEIARGVTQAYRDFRLSVRTVPEIDNYFQERIEEVREQLEDWEERRAGFMNEESISQISDERASLLQVKQEAEKDLARVNEALAGDQARLELLKTMVERAKEDPTQEVFTFIEQGNTDDDAIQQIRRQLVDRRSELYAARSLYQEDHPNVQRLTQQVEQLEQLLAQNLENYPRSVEARVEIRRSQADALRSTIEYCDGELGSFPSKEARLAAFDRMIDRLQTEYKALVERQIQAQLERAGTPDWNVIVLQAASEPGLVRLNDAIRLAIIPAIGLFIALALAFVLDGVDHSLKDAIEVERHLGLPVLGSIGRLN